MFLKPENKRPGGAQRHKSIWWPKLASILDWYVPTVPIMEPDTGWGGTLMIRQAATIAAALALSACATYSEKIAPTYVSPVIYESLNCKQIAEEATRVAQRAAEAAGAQDSQANRDNAVTAAAIIIFWPAAFFVGGDRQNAAELGRLKGEMNALQQASTRKNCGIDFRVGA